MLNFTKYVELDGRWITERGERAGKLSETRNNVVRVTSYVFCHCRNEFLVETLKPADGGDGQSHCFESSVELFELSLNNTGFYGSPARAGRPLEWARQIRLEIRCSQIG